MTPARLLLPMLLAATTAGAATAGPPLKFRRDILRRDRGDAVTLVPIDASIYAETRDQLPDLRIFDDRDREVPYAIRGVVRRRTVVDREDVPSRIVSLKVVEGEALEVVARLEEDAPEPDGVSVSTPLTDFERRVRVLGSHDGETWTPLTEGRIFDYSRFMDVRDADVSLPGRGYRLFKLVFEREADEQRSPIHELVRSRVEGGPERRTDVETILRRPFRIDRIAFQRSVEHAAGEEPTTSPEALDVLKVEADGRDRVTRVEIAADRLPLTRLSLRTTSRNFHRRARVQRPAPEGTSHGWVDIGGGTLSLYEIGDSRREALALDFPEVRADRLRLVVEDDDNPPLSVVGVDGEVVDRRLEFVASPGRNFRLEYGSDVLQSPRYDAEIVLDALGTNAPREVAELGRPARNPDYRPGLRPSPFSSRLWLIVALFLMTAVLAWAVLQAVRRADKVPVDEFE